MSFELLAVRADTDLDSRLYPVLGGDEVPIRLEADDGRPLRFTATSAICSEEQHRGLRPLAALWAVKIDVIVTDARLALACPRFEDRSAWVGGPGPTTFHARADQASHGLRWLSRRRRKALVGQVRYPWLRSAAFQSKTSWLTDETIRLGVTTREGSGTRDLVLELHLPKSVSAADVCRAVVSKAARQRLAHGSLGQDAEAELTALLDPPTLAPLKGSGFAAYHLAGHTVVSPHGHPEPAHRR